MWLPCPTCHRNKVKDTAVTVDNGKANMLEARHMCSPQASPPPLSIYNDVLVISFAVFKRLKWLIDTV